MKVAGHGSVVAEDRSQPNVQEALASSSFAIFKKRRLELAEEFGIFGPNIVTLISRYNDDLDTVRPDTEAWK